jgi:hypothetical protein
LASAGAVAERADAAAAQRPATRVAFGVTSRLTFPARIPQHFFQIGAGIAIVRIEAHGLANARLVWRKCSIGSLDRPHLGAEAGAKPRGHEGEEDAEQ